MNLFVMRFLNIIKGTKVRAIRAAVRATSIVVEACLRWTGRQILSYRVKVVSP